MPRHSTLPSLVAALLFAMAAAPSARAGKPVGEEHDVELAKVLYQAGQRAFDGGKYADAAKLFEQAWKQSERPELLWNAAQAHRKQYDRTHDVADLRLARDQLVQFGKVAPPSKDRDNSLRQLVAIDAELGRLGARDADAEREAARAAAVPSPSSEPPRADKRGSRAWIWGVVVGGLVVAGGAVTLGVLLTRDSGPPTPVTNGGNFRPAFP